MSIEDDLLESLEPDPSPPPNPVRPVPAPVQVGSVLTAPGSSVTRLLEIAGIVLITAAITTGLVAWKLGGGGDGPSPSDVDEAFVAVGQAYPARLGVAYAPAWEDGAKVLDAGQPVGMSLDTVATAWEKNKLALFQKTIKAELNKVVPNGKPEKDVTSEDRAALAKAYRGIAKGLRGGK